MGVQISEKDILDLKEYLTADERKLFASRLSNTSRYLNNYHNKREHKGVITELSMVSKSTTIHTPLTVEINVKRTNLKGELTSLNKFPSEVSIIGSKLEASWHKDGKEYRPYAQPTKVAYNLLGKYVEYEHWEINDVNNMCKNDIKDIYYTSKSEPIETHYNSDGMLVNGDFPLEETHINEMFVSRWKKNTPDINNMLDTCEALYETAESVDLEGLKFYTESYHWEDSEEDSWTTQHVIYNSENKILSVKTTYARNTLYNFSDTIEYCSKDRCGRHEGLCSITLHAKGMLPYNLVEFLGIEERKIINLSLHGVTNN